VDARGHRDRIQTPLFTPGELRLVADFMPPIVGMATPERLIEYVNTQPAEYFGLPPETFGGGGGSRGCIPRTSRVLS